MSASFWCGSRSSRRRRHLTVFLDAELYRDRVGAVRLLDELISDKQLADSWFVFVSVESAEAR